MKHVLQLNETASSAENLWETLDNTNLCLYMAEMVM